MGIITILLIIFIILSAILIIKFLKNITSAIFLIIVLLIILTIISGIIIFTIFSPINYKITHYLWLDIIFLACIFVCFTILSIYWKKQKISLFILQAVFLLLSFTDFYLHGANSICTGQEMKHEELDRETITMMKAKNKSEWFVDEKTKTPFLPFSEDKKSFFRVYVNDGYYNHTGLLPYLPYDSIKLCNIGTNRAIFDKIFMVDGYNPMMLKRYVLFNSIFRDLNYEKFLMLSNVKYIIEPDGTINILPDEKTLPRAFIVTKIENIENSFDILNKMSEPSFNPKEKAFVESANSLIINSTCQNKPHAKVLRYLPNKIIVQTDSECNGFLVLNETYYPGWKARIDSGKKKDVLKVNYCFMGIAIPGGKHIIDFIFEPKSLKIGFYISFATFLFGVVIFIIALIKKK
ncbi:MAG: YfhO family protein [Candidatus Woesearchaeota archaeon]